MIAVVNVGNHLVLDPVVPLVWAVAAAAALVAAVIVANRLWPLPLERAMRAALLTLRLAVAAAVILLLLQPTVRWEGRREVPGEVAFLLDGSRSMGVRDAAATGVAGPVSRRDAVRGVLLVSRQTYETLAGRCILNPYAFGTRTRPIGNFSPEPEDPRTDIGEALRFIAARLAAPKPVVSTSQTVSSADLPSQLAAVVVVSDGRANRGRGSPDVTARALEARGVKVHTVLVGSDKPAGRIRDVAVRDIRAPGRVFARNRPDVRATVATLGLAGRTLDVVLTVGGKEVDRRKITPPTDQAAEEVTFAPGLNTPGLARLAVAVQPVEGELLSTNNRAETTVRVDEGGIRVLYIDGRIHPEGKFVARALGEATEIDLDRRILLGDAGAAPSAADVEKVNVVILGDVPASRLPAATIAAMATQVREGGLAVLALGGLTALGPSGWAGTPVADVLPFAIRATDGQIEGPLTFRLTPDGVKHPIFLADPAAGRAMDFAALPPLVGASAVGPLHAAAMLLAESPDGKPLLAVREFGRGRTAVLTADTTWQWVMATRPAGAAGKAAADGAEVHRRFWRQLVLWLAGREPRPQADLWVVADRPRYMLVDPDNPPTAEVAAHVAGQGGPPTVRLTGPDGKPVAVPVEREGGDWRAVVPLKAAGIYTLAAEAEIGGKPARVETQLAVEEQDYETANVLADTETMERLARAGGGTFRHIDGLGTLLEELATDLPPQFEPYERRFTPAAGRVFLGIVIALLTAEWLLRRKWAVV